jgi:hypothetical protein
MPMTQQRGRVPSSTLSEGLKVGEQTGIGILFSMYQRPKQAGPMRCMIASVGIMITGYRARGQSRLSWSIVIATSLSPVSGRPTLGFVL